MKQIIIAAVWLFVGLSAVTAQTPQLHNVAPVIDVPGVEAFYPQTIHNGADIIFSRADHNGLFIYNRANAALRTLCNDPGAGYAFQVSADESSVLYRRFTIRDGRRFYSLVNRDLTAGKETILESESRTLSAPFKTSAGHRIYFIQGEPKIASSAKMATKSAGVAVTIRDRHLVLIRNGKERILDPLGAGIYIWPGLSPDGKKIVFTLAGKGTYVCDLNGTVSAELGYLNAPKWSPDGKWVVGMQDFDDGVRITRSEIAVVRADGTQKTTLTHTPDRVELFPAWGKGKEEILFSDTQGVLYRADLKIQ